MKDIEKIHLYRDPFATTSYTSADEKCHSREPSVVYQIEAIGLTFDSGEWGDASSYLMSTED